MGLVALADAEANAIHLVEPATHRLVAQLSVNGSPRDVAFLPDGHTLVAASAAAEGVGEARMWSLKAKRHNLKVRKERQVPLAGTPLQLAVSPTGLRRAAIGLEAARIDVVDFAEKAVIVSIDLPAPPRDVVWCDEHRPGPIMPEWTDTTPPELTLDSAGQ